MNGTTTSIRTRRAHILDAVPSNPVWIRRRCQNMLYCRVVWFNLHSEHSDSEFQKLNITNVCLRVSTKYSSEFFVELFLNAPRFIIQTNEWIQAERMSVIWSDKRRRRKWFSVLLLDLRLERNRFDKQMCVLTFERYPRPHGTHASAPVPYTFYYLRYAM